MEHLSSAGVSEISLYLLGVAGIRRVSTETQSGWGLAGTCGGPHVHPLLRQGQLETIAQAHNQMASKDLQGGRLRHLSGQPVPALSHLALGQLGAHQDPQMLLGKNI